MTIEADMTLPCDFHTHHGAFGALGSFTLGRFGTKGGFNVHDGSSPGSDEIFIGMARPESGLRLLPFCQVRSVDTTNFAEGDLFGSAVLIDVVPAAAVHRTLGLGVDRWTWDEGALELCTPFGPVPDPRQGWDALRDGVLPGVLAILEFDNTRGAVDATAIFALGASSPGAALLDLPGAVAVGRRGRDGFASPAVHGARPLAGFGIDLCLHPDGRVREPHWLGACAGLAWTVPAGQRIRVPLALGWFQDGFATHGLRTRYAYATLYRGLEDVLSSVLARREALEGSARSLDARLDASDLSPERRWLLAHAVRGYFGNSQLLRTESDDPVWAVHEGEYAMINTLDLAVDQVFFEERHFPWVVRELADLFHARHSFTDHLRVPGDTVLHPGGLSFSHDMGVRNQFSAPGTSCYELSGLHGCFSHMTQEQALNWPLLACTHVLMASDSAWGSERADVLAACLESLERREHPNTASRRGIPGTDSSRAGSGTEITTYDSLDPALAQARGSLYLTVKLWAAYRGLEKVFSLLDQPDRAERARNGRHRVEQAIAAWPECDGFLPALADGRNRSAILPAIEALVFPLAWGDALLASPEPGTRTFLDRLGTHLHRVLDAGFCRFDDGGWRLSSTSRNSWISKIALCQVVAERLFGMPSEPRADRAHVAWQAPGSADWGFTDQIIDGVGIGSKYYPRGVSAILYLPLAH